MSNFYISQQLNICIIVFISSIVILNSYNYQNLNIKFQSRYIYFDKFQRNVKLSVQSSANQIHSKPNNDIQFSNIFAIWGTILQEKYEILARKDKISINSSSLMELNGPISNRRSYQDSYNDSSKNSSQVMLMNINEDNQIVNNVFTTSITNSFNQNKIFNKNDLATTTFSISTNEYRNKDSSTLMNINNNQTNINNNNQTITNKRNIFRYIKRKVKSFFQKDNKEVITTTTTAITKNQIDVNKKQIDIYYPTTSTMVSYTPNGIIENMIRIIRRRFLNLVSITIDRRANNQWANSVTTSSMLTNENIRFATIRVKNKEMKDSKISNKTSIFNLFQKVTRPIRNFFTQSDDESYRMFEDFEGSSYMTQFLLSRDISDLVAPSKGLNVFGYSSAAINTNNKKQQELKEENNLFRKLKKTLRSIIPFNNDKEEKGLELFPLPSNIIPTTIELVHDIEIQAENLFSTPIVKDMKYFRNNLFGAFLTILEEYRNTSGFQTAANNLLNTTVVVGNQIRRDSVNMVDNISNEAQSVVKGIDLTTESLKNLYQASVELAQESTDKVKQWLPSNNNNPIPNNNLIYENNTRLSSQLSQQQQLQQEGNGIFPLKFPKVPTFVMPWDKYYRGEIPFFETFFNKTNNKKNEDMNNDITSIAPLLLSTREIMENMAANAVALKQDESLSSSVAMKTDKDSSGDTIIISDIQTKENIDISNNSRNMKSRVMKMFFPLSSTFVKGLKFVFSKKHPTAISINDQFTNDGDDDATMNMNNMIESEEIGLNIGDNDRSIDTNEYSELFTNDISAINAAWQEAHPSFPLIPDENNLAMIISNNEKEGEGGGSNKRSILSLAWKSFINSVPVFHMYKAYKYIRGARVDTDEIVKLAQKDEESAPEEYEDDELLDIDTILPTNIQSSQDMIQQSKDNTLKIAGTSSSSSSSSMIAAKPPSMMDSFTITQQDLQQSITSSSTNFMNNVGKEINNGMNQQFKRILPTSQTLSDLIVKNNNNMLTDNNPALAKPQELRRVPEFFEINAVNQPTRADFNFIISRRVQVAIEAALSIRTDEDAEEFFRYIGLGPIIGALLDRIPDGSNIDRIDAIKALCRIVRTKKSTALEIVSQPAVISVFCDMMEAPLKGFISLQSQSERDRNLRGQTEVVALIQRLVRSDPKSAELIGRNEKIRKILNAIIETDPLSITSNSSPSAMLSPVTDAETIRRSSGYSKNYKVRTPTNSTHTVVEYINLRPSQMARVALWGIGGVNWKPKQPGQTGLRILSLDGGGTRGVLSIAYLKEIMRRVNKNSPVHLEPYQLFDIICGTSTGGIIAVLLGAQKATLAQTETLYDDFVGKVFTSKSTLKLILEKASYDEKELEDILYKMCGDQLLLDSNQNDCSRVFCVSSDCSKVPAKPFIWRNYNYPPGQVSRYDGACIVNTKTAVRATAAAPTFFKPINWNGVNYADGALVANNPSLIAIHEARALYPNIPIEFIVSVGTGYVNMTSDEKTVEWGGMLGTIIGSATDTEPVHRTIEDFFPKEQYHRFSTSLKENYAIDETNKTVLNSFKKLAVTSIRQKELSSEIENIHLQKLIKALRCGINAR